MKKYLMPTSIFIFFLTWNIKVIPIKLSDLVKYENNEIIFESSLDKYDEAIDNANKEEIIKVLEILSKNYYVEKIIDFDLDEMYSECTKNITREKFEQSITQSLKQTNTVLDLIVYILKKIDTKFNKDELIKIKKNIIENANSAFKMEKDKYAKKIWDLLLFITDSDNQS